jgi:hypothetical protein
MEKIFKYQFTTGSFCLEDSDEMEYAYEDFEYSPLEDDLQDAIVEEVYYDYFIGKNRQMFTDTQRFEIKRSIKNLIDDIDGWQKVANLYEEELKEVFKDEAYEEYKSRGC